MIGMYIIVAIIGFVSFSFIMYRLKNDEKKEEEQERILNMKINKIRPQYKKYEQKYRKLQAKYINDGITNDLNPLGFYNECLLVKNNKLYILSTFFTIKAVVVTDENQIEMPALFEEIIDINEIEFYVQDEFRIDIYGKNIITGKERALLISINYSDSLYNYLVEKLPQKEYETYRFKN